MYFATNYLTTELADSKLKYGLFNRVISCHDRLFQNCQNSCSKCAPQALNDDASLASLTPAKRRRLVTLVLDAPWAPSCLNTKKSFPDNQPMSGSGL